MSEPRRIGPLILDWQGAPFAMMGIVNFLVALVALFVLARAPGMPAKEVRAST